MHTSAFRAGVNRPVMMPIALALTACFYSVSISAQTESTAVTSTAPVAEPYVLIPDRVFDGFKMREGYGVAVQGTTITAVGSIETMPPGRRYLLPGTTLLPGFIDLHAHLVFQGVSTTVVLRHGITTVRDLTGPARPPSGGDGSLRHLMAGPIITAPHGYPLPVFGSGAGGHGHGQAGALVVEVADVEQARQVVNHIIDAGASVIKIALEPGGSPGAPWSMHTATVPPPWPVLSLAVVKEIVQQTHERGRKVSAHLSNAAGAELALDGGVDEWAHMPCEALPEALIARAVKAGVKIVGTLDTLSHCRGIFANTHDFVSRGGTLLYGTDMAHVELPWGINARELELMMHASRGQMSAEDVLSAATARAGEHVGLAPVGQLVPGAPADIIGIKGNPLQGFKRLEYPELVVAGGTFVVDDLVRMAAEGQATNPTIGHTGLERE